MTALIVDLNGLYSSKKHESDQIEVEKLVRAFYWQKNLKRRGVAIARVRYVFMCPFNAPPALTITCSNTGWHLEHGVVGSEHVTVDFRKRDELHVTTRHIYRIVR